MPRRLCLCLMFCAAALLLTGCGDDPQVQMQRIRIALESDNPDQALDLANDMLAAHPDMTDALALKAQAQLRLAQLDAARQTLESLAKRKGDDPQPRRLLLDWCHLHLAHLLGQSGFNSDQRMQDAFDDTVTFGGKLVAWLEDRGQSRADGEYHRARFAQAQADRLRVAMPTRTSRLRDLNIDGDADSEWQTRKAEAETRIEQQLDIVQQHLAAALATDPRHVDAIDMASQLYMHRRQWAKLWSLGEQAVNVSPLPASVAENLITALLAVPDDHTLPAQRMALGRKLLEQVDAQRHGSTAYRLATARLHLRAGDPDEATPLLRSILKSQSRHRDGRYLLAQCYYQQAEYARALDLLRPLAVEAARSPGIQTLYGLTLAAAGDMGGAKEALRRATELNPDNPAPREAFLNLMMQLGHVEAAQEDIDHYLELKPADPQALAYKLRFEISRDREQAVATLLRRIEKIDPLTFAHLTILIDGYNYLNDYAKAETLAVEQMRMQPDSLAAQLRLVEARLMRGETDAVEPMITALIADHGGDSRVTVLAARWHVQRGEYEQAAQGLEDVVAAEPSNLAARLLLTRCLIAQTRNDEALQQVEAVLDQDPANIDAHALAARVYQIVGDEASAGEHLARIDTTRISVNDHASLLAQIKMRQGAEMEAVAIAEQAVRQGSRDPIMRLILAAHHAQRGDAQRAESQLMKLIELAPDNATGYVVLARFYGDTGNYQRGVAQLRALRQADDVLARLAEATLHASQRKFDPALEALLPAFNPALHRSDPALLALADAIARLYAMHGQFDKPYAVYQAMIDAGVQPKRAMLRQIDLHRNVDGKQVTLQRLEKFMRSLSRQDTAMRGAGIKRYAMLGHTERALQWVDTWLAQQPDAIALHLWKGDLHMAAERAGDAAKAFEKALQLDGDSAVTHARLARAREQAYDYPAAEAAWRNMAALQGSARTAALTGLGGMFLRIGLSNQAAETFASLDRMGAVRDPALNLALGQALLDLDDIDRARRRLEQVVAGSRQYAGAQLLLAREDLRLGRDNEAQRRIEQMMRRTPTQGELARQLLQANFDDRAIREMASWAMRGVTWSELPPAQRSAWLMIGVNLSLYGQQWAQAEQALAALAAEQPESNDFAAARALLLVSLNRAGDAGQVYRNADGIGDSEVGRAIAVMLGGQADLDDPMMRYCAAVMRGDAIAAKQAVAQPTSWRTVYRGDLQAAATEGNPAAARLLLGAVAAMKANMPPLGVRFCDMAIEAAPDWTPAHAMKLGLLIDRQQPIEGALAAAPRGGGLGLFIKAREHDAARRHAQAAEAMAQLAKREADNDLVMYMLAKQLDHAGQYEQAMAALRKVAQRDGPVRVMAINDLAYMIVEHQPAQLEEAHRLAREALKAVPSSAPLLDTLGWIAFRRGQRDEALAYLSRAAATIGQLPEVQYHLGAVYRAMGNDRWARYYLQAAARGPANVEEVSEARRLLQGERLSEVAP